MTHYNFINPFSLAKRIDRPLILDGAMGSLLQQMGNKPDSSMWMSLVNLKKPADVFKIHRQYILAGADIITTNTFRTNPAAVNAYETKINIRNLVKQSVRIAVSAAKDLPVFIAGSNAPAEDCYQVQRKVSKKILEQNHKEHIELLIENGCHFILNETQSHFDEIQIICKFCSKNKIPFVVSLFTDYELRILSGEKVDEVIKYILDFSPLAVSLNCISQNTFLKFYKRSKLNFNWGTYINCLPSPKRGFSFAQAIGSSNFTDENNSSGVSPSQYSALIKTILKKSPSFVGACCGSTPVHTKKIKELLDGRIKN